MEHLMNLRKKLNIDVEKPLTNAWNKRKSILLFVPF